MRTSEPARPAETVAFRFDARLDPELFAALAPGGAISPLLGYARSNYPVDIHFRRDWVSGSQHVQVHVGLNRLLDIEYRQGRVRLHPMRAVREDFDFHTDWLSWSALPTSWPDAWELFLDQAVPWASDQRGAMGAGIAPRAHQEHRRRWAVTQGFGVQFRDERLRKEMFSRLTADLKQALEPSPIPAVPNPLKLETSVLYVDASGDLIVTEAQSRRASELPWAAGITIANARLLRLWLDHDPGARDMLIAAIRARVVLGLLPPTVPLPRPDGRVVPLVQAQAGISPRLRRNITLVWERLHERGVPEANDLRLLEWSLSGREIMRRPDGRAS